MYVEWNYVIMREGAPTVFSQT